MTSADPRNVFVGRISANAWLEERLEAAFNGAGSVAFVTGERGVGKTALVGDFLRRIRAGPRPLTVVAGRCAEHQGPGEAFLPFLDALGRLLAGVGHDQTVVLLRKYAPTICVQLPEGLVPDTDGALHKQALGATKERLIRESGDFMEAASRFFPIVMFLEDLQWADPPSVELLTHLGHRIARWRTLILATFRGADVDAGNAPLRRCSLDLQAQGLGREIALESFPPEDITAYLEARCSPHCFPAGLAALLHERTEGLPLFVRSLVDLLIERGEIAPTEDTWTLTRPLHALSLEPDKGLRELVRHQLEALPGDERDLLQHASVAGDEFLSSIVASLVELDELDVEERLRRLSRLHGVIEERGEEELPDGTLATRYRFTHTLFQSVLYEDLVARRRALLHERVAERLERHWADQAPRHAAEIAQHYERGRNVPAAARFRALVGDNAAQRFAYAEAEEQYDCALGLLQKLPREAEVQSAVSIYARRGVVRHAQAQFDEAVSDFAQMLDCARAAGSGRQEWSALAGMCRGLFFAHRTEEMAVRACEALETAALSRDAARHLEARSWVAQIVVLEGRLAEAIPLLEDVIERARKSDHRATLLTGLAFRGFTYYWQAEYGPAEACFAEGVVLAEELRDGFEALAMRMFLGQSRVNLGRLSRALADFDEAIGMARLNGDRFWLPRLISHVGWIHRELHGLDRAVELDREALRLARERPAAWAPEAEPMFNLCLDHARAGRREDALALLEELEEKSRQGAWFPWLHEMRFESVSAEHWLALHDLHLAREHAMRLANLARRLGARTYLCAAERLRARAALVDGSDLEEAAAGVEGALNALNDHPAPLESWKAARVLGQVWRRLGRERDAQRVQAQAADAVRSILAGVEDEQLRSGFLASAEIREVLGGSDGAGNGTRS